MDTADYTYLSAQIDLSAIVHNCEIARRLIPAGCRLCVAVKCNAYGHGIDVVLPALDSAGVDMLAVAAVCEAVQLRELGWTGPTLLMGSEFSIYRDKQKRDIARWLVENDIRITAMTENDIQLLAEIARKLNKKVLVHVMLDTGMSRMGLGEQSLSKLIATIRGHRNIEIDGLYTHFSTADKSDKTYSNYQLKRFDTFRNKLGSSALNIPLIHTSNSAALIDLPDSHYNMVRPGISIYGYHTSPEMLNKPDLQPAMKLVSYIAAVKPISEGTVAGYGNTWKAPRDSLIGLVPIGYGDGYDRRLSNKGKMKIAGNIVPVIGRVSMDLTIVDLTDLADKQQKVTVGQQITIIDNDPGAPNSVEAIAALLQTIPYEIVTRLGTRIKRVML